MRQKVICVFLVFALSSQAALAQVTDKETKEPERSWFAGWTPYAAAAAVAITAISIYKVLTRKIRVLVVEDNKVNQAVTGRMLKQLGIDVTIVDNTADAIATAGKYDAILMDNQVFEYHGAESPRDGAGCEAARRIRRNSDTPVVMHSSEIVPDEMLQLQKGRAKKEDYRDVIIQVTSPRGGKSTLSFWRSLLSPFQTSPKSSPRSDE